MLSYFMEFLPTILICLILLIIVAAVIWDLARNKKAGKSSCSGGCKGCPMNGTCHRH